MKILNIALILILLLSVLVTGIASAEKSITLDVPASVPVNQVTTVPVTIHDADNILGFFVHVPNTVSGTIITINATEPLSGGSYTVSSSVEQTEQAVLWFTAIDGVVGTQTLFYLDVLPTSQSPSSIPLTIEVPEEMYDSDLKEVQLEYPVIDAVLVVSGTGSPSVSGQEETPVAVPTGVDEREESVQEVIPSETVPEATQEFEPVPTFSPEALPDSETSAQSPGFSAALIAVAAAAGFFAGTRRYL